MSLDERTERQLEALIGRVEELEKDYLSLADERTKYFLTDGSRRINGKVIIDVTDIEALLVRKRGDSGDVFTIDTSNAILKIDGTLDIVHTATEADDHALEVDADAAGFGDVKAIDIDYITGAIDKGQDEGVILINIDETAADGGDVFAVEVLATDGDAGIYGLKAGALVGPVHQDSGTFDDPTTATDNHPSTNVNAMKDGSTGTTTAIFEADDEYIVIGAAAAFEEIEFILTTTASVSIKPTFWYSIVGTEQFTQFTPVDGTNGFRNTGVVAWDASDLTDHVAAGVTNTFDIKIIRTRNVLQTDPILGYAKVAATTEYIWDKSGNLNIATATIEGKTIVDVTDTEALLVRKDGDGGDVLIVDTSTPKVVLGGVSVDVPMTVWGNLIIQKNAAQSIFQSFVYSDTGFHTTVFQGLRSKGSSASKTVVANGNDLFKFAGFGYDGDQMVEAARILFEVDGTPGDDDMPGRIVFFTTADGENAPTERMRIDNAGDVTITGTVTAPLVDTKREVVIVLTDNDTTLVTGDDFASFVFVVPSIINGYNITGVLFANETPSTSGNPSFAIYNVTGTGDVLSTNCTIDINEQNSSTAATPPVIDTSEDDLATGDRLRFDCDVAGTGAEGISVHLLCEKP